MDHRIPKTIHDCWFGGSPLSGTAEKCTESKKKEKGISLLKNIFLFFVASFIPKTISFFLIPLYTNCLTTQEYGTIDLITATAQLLLPILTLQIQDAVLRFTLSREQEPAHIYSAGLQMIAGGCCILFIGTGIVYASGIVELDRTYMLFFLVTFLSGALNHITTCFLRAALVNKNWTH